MNPMTVLLWFLAGTFIVLDLVFTFAVKSEPAETFLGHVQAFYKDVNGKFLQAINSVWTELVTNWHEGLVLLALFLFVPRLYFALGALAYILVRVVVEQVWPALKP